MVKVAETSARSAMDALAARGVRFSSAFSAAPVTLTSHASILTGADAAARGEEQRIHQDRFAGARLAGEDGQPGGELQFGCVDDREVADLNMQQHGVRQSCG